MNPLEKTVNSNYGKIVIKKDRTIESKEKNVSDISMFFRCVFGRIEMAIPRKFISYRFKISWHYRKNDLMIDTMKAGKIVKLTELISSYRLIEDLAKIKNADNIVAYFKNKRLANIVCKRQGWKKKDKGWRSIYKISKLYYKNLK